MPAGGAPGRYVVIFAGDGTMALDNVQVYATGEDARGGTQPAAPSHAAVSARLAGWRAIGNGRRRRFMAGCTLHPLCIHYNLLV